MRSMRLYLLIVIMLLSGTLSVSAAVSTPVTMNVTNGEVRDVLTALAAVSGISIVADDSVTGKITIQLNEIPFDTALDIVTKAKGLNYQKLNNVIIVGSPEQMNRGFGQINIFKLQYAKAADVVNLLGVVFKDDQQTTQQGQPSQTVTTQSAKNSTNNQTNINDQQINARLKADDATNSIIFSGTPSEVDQIRKILTEIDIPYQQVSLEAQVVAINNDAVKNMGVEWEWSKAPNYPEYDPPTYDSNGTITEPGKYTRDKEDMVGTIRFGKSPGGYPYEMYYQFKINALVTDGKANILAKPKIMTINGKEAVINIGGEVPISVTTISDNTTTTSVEYKEAGIILKYTPRINADGYITATVHTEVSSPVYVEAMKAYRFNKRSADTEVRLKDGETMVIGGLIGKEEAKNYSKVPFLGDLPILGSLFRNSNNTKNESEVVIFLTAHIVK